MRSYLEGLLAFALTVAGYFAALTAFCWLVAALSPLDLGDILPATIFWGSIFGWRREHVARLKSDTLARSLAARVIQLTSLTKTLSIALGHMKRAHR